MSTASLLVGVAAANTGSGDVLVAGVAGLVPGAMSMAALRVMFWGALAMALTAGVGALFGAVV